MQDSCHAVAWLKTNRSKKRRGCLVCRWRNGYCYVCGTVMTIMKGLNVKNIHIKCFFNIIVDNKCKVRFFFSLSDEQ